MIGFRSDDDMDPFFDEQDPTSVTSRLIEAKKTIGKLQKEIQHLNNAIVLLKGRLDAEGISYFGYKPLTKKPTEMSKEELVEANEAATKRMASRAFSPESVPPPTPEQEAELMKERKLFQLSDIHGNRIDQKLIASLIEQIQVNKLMKEYCAANNLTPENLKGNYEALNALEKKEEEFRKQVRAEASGNK